MTTNQPGQAFVSPRANRKPDIYFIKMDFPSHMCIGKRQAFYDANLRWDEEPRYRPVGGDDADMRFLWNGPLEIGKTILLTRQADPDYRGRQAPSADEFDVGIIRFFTPVNFGMRIDIEWLAGGRFNRSQLKEGWTR